MAQCCSTYDRSHHGTLACSSCAQGTLRAGTQAGSRGNSEPATSSGQPTNFQFRKIDHRTHKYNPDLPEPSRRESYALQQRQNYEFLNFQWAATFLACKSATWGMALTDPRRADTAWSDINIDVKLHIRLFVSVPNPRIGSISILTTELSTKPFTHAPDRDSNNNNYYYYNYQLCRFHQLSTMSPVLDLID